MPRNPLCHPHVVFMSPSRIWPDVDDCRRRIMRSNTGKLHRRDLPGTPDLVFPGRRAVIQVHGCFWHHHEGCSHATVPSTRRAYWEPKLIRNRDRDRQSEAELVALGWSVETVWECDLKDTIAVRERLRKFLDALDPAFSGPPHCQVDNP